MLCKCSGKYIDIYFILKIAFFYFFFIYLFIFFLQGAAGNGEGNEEAKESITASEEAAVNSASISENGASGAVKDEAEGVQGTEDSGNEAEIKQEQSPSEIRGIYDF